MTDALVMELCQKAFATALLAGGPLLAVVLVVGVAVSLVQAVTQVQEASLVFVPKLLGAGVVLLVAGYWMLEQLLHFTGELLGDFSRLVH